MAIGKKEKNVLENVKYARPVKLKINRIITLIFSYINSQSLSSSVKCSDLRCELCCQMIM